jgi:hypothetical protein
MVSGFDFHHRRFCCSHLLCGLVARTDLVEVSKRRSFWSEMAMDPFCKRRSTALAANVLPKL